MRLAVFLFSVLFGAVGVSANFLCLAEEGGVPEERLLLHGHQRDAVQVRLDLAAFKTSSTSTCMHIHKHICFSDQCRNKCLV